MFGCKKVPIYTKQQLSYLRLNTLRGRYFYLFSINIVTQGNGCTRVFVKVWSFEVFERDTPHSIFRPTPYPTSSLIYDLCLHHYLD